SKGPYWCQSSARTGDTPDDKIAAVLTREQVSRAKRGVRLVAIPAYVVEDRGHALRAEARDGRVIGLGDALVQRGGRLVEPFQIERGAGDEDRAPALRAAHG